MFSPIEKFDIINFFYFKITNYLDFSLTNISLYLIFCFVLIIIFFFQYNFNFLPNFNQIYLEKIMKFVFEILNKQILYNKGHIFFPFILSIFINILILNIYGVIPYNFPVTAHLILTFFFSILIWLCAIFVGLYENGYYFYKLFVPDVPNYLLPFLILIEITSYIMRVFSLAIRLSANITSGHVLLFTIAGFLVKMIKLNLLMSLFIMIVLIFVFVLELGVAFLQAYVFIVLTCIYLNDSLNLTH